MAQRSYHDLNKHSNLHDDWNPMQEAFHDPHFNTYKDGPGANLELDKQPCFTGSSQKKNFPCKLFVGNIPLDVTKEGIENTFRTVGNPVSVIKGKVSANSTTAWAFVVFNSLREAEDAMRKLNRKPPMNLKIQIAKEKEFDGFVKKRPSNGNEFHPEPGQQNLELTMKKPSIRNYGPSGKGRGLAVASYVDPRAERAGVVPQEKVDVRQFQPYGGSNYDESNTTLLRGVQRANGPGGPKKFVMGRGSFDREMDAVCQPRGLGKVVKDESAAKNSIETYVQKKNGTYEFSKREYPPSLSQNSCTLCKQPSTQFCAECKDWYCSRNCQVKDWPRHRNYCMKVEVKTKPIEDEFARTNDSPPKKDWGKGNGHHFNQQKNPKRESKDNSSPKEVSGFVKTKVCLHGDKNSQKTDTPQFPGKEPMHSKRTSDRNKRGDSDNSFEKESSPPKNGSSSKKHSYKSPHTNYNDKSQIGIENHKSERSNDDIKKPLKGCELSEQLPEEFTHVNVQVVLDPGEYWVQLTSNIKETFDMCGKMEMMKDTAPVKLSVGAYCMAKFEDMWYRAKITSLEPVVKVFFIDFGNEETALPSEMRELPDIMKVMKSQAIRIRLAPETSEIYRTLGVGSDLSVKSIHRNIENGVITVHVEGEIYTQALQKEREEVVEINTLDNEKQDPELPLQNVTVLLKVNTTCYMGVTEYSNDQEFLACLIPSEIKHIYNNFFTVFQEECEHLKCVDFTPNIGEIILAKSDTEGWLRAYVLHKSSKKEYSVASCDLGFVEVVKEVKRLPRKCREIVQFAVQCKLLEGKSNCMENYTGNITIINCTSDSAVAVVNDANGEMISKIEIKKWEPPYELYEELKCVELKDGDCVISAEMSPFELYIRPLTNCCIEIYNRLLQDVAKHCFKSSPLNYPPKVGQVLASKYSEDGNYYRAVVREIHPSKGIKVQYIDFGNVEYVQQNELIPLAKELRDVECSVVKVILKDVLDRPLNEEVQRLFKDLILGTTRLKLKLITPQSNEVELYTKDGNYLNGKINEILLPGWKKGVVDKQIYTTHDVRGDNLEIGKLVKLIVMNVVHTTVVVRPENSKTLNILENDMQEEIEEYCNQTNESYTPRELELCLAKIDHTWYRCVCISGGNPLTLYLFDLGQVREAYHENIRKYLEQFTKLPAVGIRCNVRVKRSIKADDDHVRKYLTTMKVIAAEVIGKQPSGDGLPEYVISVPELDEYLETLQ